MSVKHLQQKIETMNNSSSFPFLQTLVNNYLFQIEFETLSFNLPHKLWKTNMAKVSTDKMTDAANHALTNAILQALSRNYTNPVDTEMANYMKQTILQKG